MYRIFLIVFALLMCAPYAFAQKQAPLNSNGQFWQGEARIANASFTKAALGSNYKQQDIEDYLYKTLPTLQTSGAGLLFTDKNQSPIGVHYSFIQTYQNIPVYGTQIRVNLDKQGNIGLITENTYNLSNNGVQSILSNKSDTDIKQLVQQFAAHNMLSTDNAPRITLFFTDETNAEIAIQFSAWTQAPKGYFEYLLNLSGQILYQRDLQHYFTLPKSTQTETVPAQVFIPNPTTSAGVVYGQGGKYKDNEDADAPELTNELKNVTIDVTFEDGVYKLENNFVKIAEFDNPVILPVTATLPQFNFTRSDDGFEDVNAYYHINTYQLYLQTLGFSLVQTQVLVDTHGKNGDDQSLHIFSGGIHKLIFGSGHSVGKHHVDDAEDADVVVHEYGHAISASACPNCNSGTERTAIDEAVCDYLATSYKRNIYAYNWQNMFSWDGHNEFWNGRNVASSKHYPEDNKNDIYYRSEIFSSVLMQVWEALGKEVADKLVINALYQFSSGISMETAANILIYVDNQLYSGEHVSTLQSLLQLRGLLEYQVNAGPDFSVCLGESITLGVPNSPVEAPEGINRYWSPGLTLNDSTLANPIANPDRPTTYTLYYVDKSSNIAYTDEAFVNVNYCFPNQPGEEIKLLNSDRFFKRRGNLIVEIPPGTEKVSINIYDSFGRWVKSLAYTGDIRIEINADEFMPGIYIMLVETNSKKATFKIEKVR